MLGDPSGDPPPIDPHSIYAVTVPEKRYYIHFLCTRVCTSLNIKSNSKFHVSFTDVKNNHKEELIGLWQQVVLANLDQMGRL